MCEENPPNAERIGGIVLCRPAVYEQRANMKIGAPDSNHSVIARPVLTPVVAIRSLLHGRRF